MKLTDHFSLSEFEVTSTGLDNKIPEFCVLSNIELICHDLEHIRCLLSVKLNKSTPIRITSGYRSFAVNKAVGGVPNSLHLLGRAVDFTCNDFDSLLSVIEDLVKYDDDFEFDQIIVYRKRKFIHFGMTRFISDTPRKQVLYK